MGGHGDDGPACHCGGDLAPGQREPMRPAETAAHHDVPAAGSVNPMTSLRPSRVADGPYVA